MVNINEVLNGFIGEVAKFKSEIGQSLSILNDKIEKLNNERAEFAKEKEALADRETEVKKIENIVVLESQARQMMKEARDLSASVTQSKDSFENYKNNTMRELNLLKNELSEKEKYIKKEYEILDKAKKALEEDKATYKNKVASSIVDLANKK